MTDAERFEMRPIGVVRNAAPAPADLPRGGLPSEVLVDPEYAAGLDGIARASHIIVVAWLDRAGRQRLRARPRGAVSGPERGVFATRSPARPNPIGLATVPLLGRDGPVLRVGPLDFADGTPVLDIKPYSTGFDGAFSARGEHDLTLVLGPADAELPRLIHEAALFHGERCAAVVTAARLLYHGRERWGVAEKDGKLRLDIGEDGCLADALQALTGARFGDGRLRCSADGSFRLAAAGAGAIAFRPKPWPSAEAAMTLPLETLLALEDA